MSSEMVLPETTPAGVAGSSAPRNGKGRDGRIVVVYVIDNMRLGGTELNAVRTAERLDRERFELRVVCLGEDGPLTERYRAIGVPVVNMPIRSFYGWSMLKSGLRFVRYVRKARADVVHAHDVYSNIFASVWAPVARVPVLITSRRWWTSLPNRKLKVGSRFAVSRSSAVLANSEAVAQLVMSETRAPAEKVWTITNFADENAFGLAPDEERNRLRRGWNAPENALVIGCVSRLDPLKDHATLLRAFATVRVQSPEAFLVLIGDGECRGSLETLARELGIGDVLHFAGELRTNGNLHRGFDISVLSSVSEGFPNTLVEAMAAGRPVVATSVGGCADAVVNGETGLLVPSGDPGAFAQALHRLIASAEVRRDFGEAALRRASRLYSADAAIGAVENMYDRLLSPGTR